jgi:hypothetical protein
MLSDMFLPLLFLHPEDDVDFRLVGQGRYPEVLNFVTIVLSNL